MLKDGSGTVTVAETETPTTPEATPEAAPATIPAPAPAPTEETKEEDVSALEAAARDAIRASAPSTRMPEKSLYLSPASRRVVSKLIGLANLVAELRPAVGAALEADGRAMTKGANRHMLGFYDICYSIEESATRAMKIMLGEVEVDDDGD